MAASMSAQHARRGLRDAQADERLAVVTYVDEALSAGWPWDRIAAELDVSPTAIRRYYDRNKRRTHGGDI